MRLASLCSSVAFALASLCAMPAFAQPAPQQSESQQLYVQRRLASPAPKVAVALDRKSAEASELAKSPKGIVFGSIGVSAAWSIGVALFQDQVSLHRIDQPATVHIGRGNSGGSFYFRQIEEALPSPGEKLGVMSYGAFKAQLDAGEYELVSAEAWQSIGMRARYTIAAFKPVRFTIAPGKPVYLGRLVFVPRLQEIPASTGRPARELEGVDPTPSFEVTEFTVWVQDALESDRKLAQVAEGEVVALPPALLAASPAVFRAQVEPAELDHAGRRISRQF